METEGQLHAPVALIPEMLYMASIIYGAEWAKNNLAYAGNRTPTVQFIADCYIDWAILDLQIIEAA
jgi:hypothetical protein